MDFERMNSPGPGSPIVSTHSHPRSRQASLFRSNTVGSPLDFKPLAPESSTPTPATRPVRPTPYRFLSLLSTQPPRLADAGTMDPDRVTDSEQEVHMTENRRTRGSRSNSASAAALMGLTTSPTSPRTPLPTSESTSALNLMAATSVAPRRKSEDWSNSRARGEALRAIQGDLSAYANGDNNWKRRSGEILATWDKCNEADKKLVVKAKKAEDLFEEDPVWGKKIIGTNVWAGEVSAKWNKGQSCKARLFFLCSVAEC